MPEFTHIFGTKEKRPNALGFGRVIQMRQVHGDTIIKADGKTSEYECDAIITDIVNLPLAVKTADCVPILLCDAVTGAIAAIHSGWKGTALNIAPKTITKLCEIYGSEPQNISAFIGPAICGKCYEVGEEVIDAVGLHYAADSRHIDLRSAIFNQLRNIGVEHITIHKDCTRCNPDLYYSHRAQNRGEPPQNNFSIIVRTL